MNKMLYEVSFSQMRNKIVTQSAKTLVAGCLPRMLSRPFEPGDIELYYKLRNVFLDEIDMFVDYRPNYARDHAKGAQGD